MAIVSLKIRYVNVLYGSRVVLYAPRRAIPRPGSNQHMQLHTSATRMSVKREITYSPPLPVSPGVRARGSATYLPLTPLKL